MMTQTWFSAQMNSIQNIAMLWQTFPLVCLVFRGLVLLINCIFFSFFRQFWCWHDAIFFSKGLYSMSCTAYISVPSYSLNFCKQSYRMDMKAFTMDTLRERTGQWSQSWWCKQGPWPQCHSIVVPPAQYPFDFWRSSSPR